MGILVHQDIPHSRVNISSTVQAVAVTVFMEQRITICSVYSSERHALTTQSLKLLFEQLPPPILVLGDLNGHNQMWGSVQGPDTQNYLRIPYLMEIEFGTTGAPK